MPTIDLDAVAFETHENAIQKGFWDPNNKDTHTIFYLKQLAMIHSEVSEVLEAIRKEKGDDKVVEELADIIIRTLDLYWGLVEDGYTGYSIQGIMEEKTAYNRERDRMHGVLA